MPRSSRTPNSVCAAVFGLFALAFTVGSASAVGNASRATVGSIAFVRADPAAPGPQAIWVMNADGSGQQQLSTHPSDEFADPAWSRMGGRSLSRTSVEAASG